MKAGAGHALQKETRRCNLSLSLTNRTEATVSQRDNRVERLHWVVEVVVRRHGLAVSHPKTPATVQGMGGQAVKADTVDGCLTFLLTFRLYRM